MEDTGKQLLSRLKSYYYSLYEVENELSLIDKSRKRIISGAEYDYLSSLKLRKEELENNIKELLKP